jgi:hypothetical protein
VSVISANLYQGNAFLLKNLGNYNCAEVAGLCNNADTIRIIFKASRMAGVPSYYWHSPLRKAACEGQLEALTAILDAVGDNFVVSFFLKFLAPFLECFPMSRLKREIETRSNVRN